MKRILPYILIGMGVLFLLGSAGLYLYAPAHNKPGAASLPGSLAGLPLVSQRTGQAALVEINQLHGKTFPLTAGSVGEYGPTGQLTIWVSQASSNQMAGEILAAMRDKISEGNSPFTPTGLTQVGGKAIYELEGMGQAHYYFRSEELVIWLAVDADLAEDALTGVLRFYP